MLRFKARGVLIMRIKDGLMYIIKNRIPFSVSIICAYALYLRMVILYNHTLWTDEIYQLNLMRGTFIDLLKAVPKYEYCSYLSGDYYLIYPFFKIFSFNNKGLAIPHIIATIIGFYILYLICKRYFKTIWAYFITFGVICFNATLINHATEIRTYAVLPTLALATFYVFQKITDSNFKLSALKKTGVIIFFVSVIWFHVYGILIFTSCLAFFILAGCREKDSRAYLKNMVFLAFVVLLISMPLWLYSVMGSHLGYRQEDPFYYIPNPFHNFLGFFKGVFGNLVGFKKLYFLLPGVIIPFFFSCADRYKQLLFLTFIVIIPIGCILFSDVMQKYWFIQRQFIWVMPLFAFYLGWVWDSLFIVLRRIRK